MANPIVEQINAELESLQQELENFKSKVEYLNVAEGHVKKAVETVNYAEAHFDKKIDELKDTYNSFIKLTDSVSQFLSKIDAIDFPERLDNIEQSVEKTISNLNETKDATIEELHNAAATILKADFEGRFKMLQLTVENSVKSNKYLTTIIEKQKFHERIEDFRKSVNQKLKSSIQELQENTKHFNQETSKTITDLNLPVRIDKVDANIAGILSSISNVQGRIDSLERNILDRMVATSTAIKDGNSEIAENLKKQQRNIYITWGIIIFCAIVIIIVGKYS